VTHSDELINKFNKYASKFQEVLLIGDVPASYIEALNESNSNSDI
jgi:predicted ATPase